ncbi:helix-turn-helix transcriptional regulator [Streptomyces sp. NPDC001194]|uniref:helix-turn-helix transcriptional regulator n=1 Tax=Streptomyces sp. NPDC001194 TaxID=3364547 RepID=UPI00369107AC
MDRQRDLPGLRPVVGARLRGQGHLVPVRFPPVVKPTRVTNTIRAQRFAHDEMTQAELARRIGVSRQTVIAIEQGRYSPSLEMAFQIAQVFGVPLDGVFQYSPGGGANGTCTPGDTDNDGGDD